MAAPAAIVAARVAVLVLDDLLVWELLAAAVAVTLLLLPILPPILGFGAILALFSGLSGTSQGGGPVWGGNPTTVAVSQIPPTSGSCSKSPIPRRVPCTGPFLQRSRMSGPGSARRPVSSPRPARTATGSSSCIDTVVVVANRDEPMALTEPACPIHQQGALVQLVTAGAFARLTATNAFRNPGRWLAADRPLRVSVNTSSIRLASMFPWPGRMYMRARANL
jgi:hypothetical protein